MFVETSILTFPFVASIKNVDFFQNKFPKTERIKNEDFETCDKFGFIRINSNKFELIQLIRIDLNKQDLHNSTLPLDKLTYFIALTIDNPIWTQRTA